MTLRALVLSLALLPLCAVAQERLSPQQRTAALLEITRQFQTGYVFPEMRPTLVARLAQQQKKGRYDTDDPVVFAERITEDLREVSHDRHLSLRVDPAAYAAQSAGKADAAEGAYWRQMALRTNHGLIDQQILPGNIRYLRIDTFHWIDDETGLAYDAAMRFLKDADAVVIDLRNNGGGSHGAVRYLVSHFLAPQTLELSFLEGSAAPKQSWTLEHLPAGRLIGKPLYVLTNSQTASAAEAFTYDVQQFKLGELVGEKTAGAANNNSLLPIAPSFILSLSYGRPVHAVSGTNWEGAGIVPDTAVPSEQALAMAQRHALDRLDAAPKATPEQRAEYAWAKVGVEGQLHPARPDAPTLAALAGRYVKADPGSAPVDITLRDGALWMERAKRPAARLSPLAQDVFAVEGFDVLRVRLTGPTLELLWRDEPAPRVFKRL
jgi:hypothetical protein